LLQSEYDVHTNSITKLHIGRYVFATAIIVCLEVSGLKDGEDEAWYVNL
jgi:hypothetical protein